MVARLDAASEVERGEEAELWVDATKLHLFDPSPARACPRLSRSPDQASGEPAAQQVGERVLVAGGGRSSSRRRSSTSSSQSWVRRSR